MSPIPVKIEAQESKPFNHFYGATGYVNIDFTLTDPIRKMYKYFSSFHNHFQYMRMHNTLTAHGRGDFYLKQGRKDFGNSGGLPPQTADRVVQTDPSGRLRFDWTVLDRVYDLLLEHGIRPIVETTFLPSCLRKSAEKWSIPRDFKRWREVLYHFVSHLQDRYGKEEIENWYFEIWNEPDIFEVWVKDSSTFLALYDYLEDGIHSVNPALKVGGPAVTQSDEGLRLFSCFLEHCSRGLNYATGRFGARINFLSVHCKGGSVEDCNPSSKLIFDSIRQFLEIIREFPEFKDLEFFNDESGIVWGGNLGVNDASWLNFRNTHYAAGFVCKLVSRYCRLVEDEYGMNMGIMDIDNCQLQWERYLFSGNRSQFTPLTEYPSTDLIRKPVFNAYILLSRLGETRLKVSCNREGFNQKYSVLPTRTEKTLSILIWNFEDGMDDEVNWRQITLEVEDIPFSGPYKLLHYRIDRNHSNAYALWSAQGKPTRPSIEQIKAIRAREGLELYTPVQDIYLEKKRLVLDVEMPMHAVSLLILVPENQEKPAVPILAKATAEENFHQKAQVFLKWQPNAERDFLCYRLWRREASEDEFTLISDSPTLNTAVFTDLEVEGERTYHYRLQAVNASTIESDLSDPIELTVP